VLSTASEALCTATMLAGPLRRRRLRLETRAAALGIPDRGDMSTSAATVSTCRPVASGMTVGGLFVDFEPNQTRCASEGRSDVARRGAVQERPGAVRWVPQTPSTRWWREVRSGGFEGAREAPLRQRGLEGFPG